MNNIFKSNSRFSCLIDDIQENKKNESKINKFNSFKSERRVDYLENNKKDRYKERETKLREKKEFLELEKNKKIEESLHINNFPELITKKKPVNIDKKINTSFIELFKNNIDININNNLDPDINDLKPGHILIKIDPITREIITKTKPYDKVDLNKKIVVKSEKQICYETIDNLVKLHEKRTQEYIDLYGYDTWEKMFKFTNWEENYSDSDSEEEELDEEDELEDKYQID
jgi:hypothetical protein